MALTEDELNEESEKVDSTSEEVLLRRVNHYYKIKDYINFYENYYKLSKDSKNSKEQLLQKFDVDKNVRNYGGALDAIEKLISISNEDIKLYEDKISILEKFNDFQRIKEVYTEMLKIWPDDPEIKSRIDKLPKSRNRSQKSFNAF